MLLENVALKVKVQLSFGHKAGISALFKLNILSKTYVIKNAQFGMLFGNVILYLLSDDCYLLLAICDLLSDSFYLKPATTCKNLFLSLVVVRLVIFLIQNTKLWPTQQIFYFWQTFPPTRFRILILRFVAKKMKWAIYGHCYL